MIQFISSAGYLIVIFQLLGSRFCHSAPVGSNEISNSIPETNVTISSLEWLQRFGYFVRPDPRLGTLLSEDSIASSIREMQRFAGIPETGVVDDRTAALMRRERCGVPDFGPMDATKKRRKRRFTLHGSSWKKSELTWRLVNENNDGLSTDLVGSILEQAFAKWEAVTNLKFFRASGGEADIMVTFNRGYHRDAYPFDGRDGVLAHAFYPHDNKGSSGDIHFDDDEVYTHNSLDGRNLFSVAFHEIGHSLGLQHSNVKDAIMFPYYQKYTGEGMELTKDDITGIQHIYGIKDQTTPIPPLGSSEAPSIKPTTTAVPPVVCIKEMKAVFLSKDKRTYVINYDKLYILRKSTLGIEKGPLLVSKYYEGVPYVDAAYTRGDGHTVLFSGNNVYVFDGSKKVLGPKSISNVYSGFPSDVKRLDAAMLWPGNGRTYLFAGKLYWRYDSVSQKIDYGYPRKIVAGWGGIPSNIDAAFAWSNGATYFFKGKTYYRLRKNYPIQVEYGYPRNIQSNWMKCRDSTGSGSTGGAGSATASLQVASGTLLLALIHALLW